MVPTGLGAFLSNVLFSLSYASWHRLRPLRAIHRERGGNEIEYFIKGRWRRVVEALKDEDKSNRIRVHNTPTL